MGRLSDSILGDESSLSYPNSQGWTEPGTSRDAALAISTTSKNLRALVLAAIDAAGPNGLTADEVAGKLNMSVLSIRPRVAELYANNIIERDGQRRTNISGMKAAVWRRKVLP